MKSINILRGLALLLMSLNGIHAQKLKIDSLAKEDYISDLKLLKEVIEKQHPDPFRFITAKQWENHFEQRFEAITKKPTYLEFVKSMPKIKDCHLSMSAPDEFVTEYVKEKFSYFPISIISLEGRMFVNTKTAPIPFLSEIIAINGKTVVDIFEEITKHSQGEGNIKTGIEGIISDNFSNYYALYIDHYPESFEIKYRDASNSNKSTSLKALNFYEEKYKMGQRISPINVAESNESINYRFYKEKSTGKLTVNTFSISEEAAYQTFSEFFRRMNKEGYKNVIIDIRSNGGGSPQIAGILYSFIAKNNFINKFNFKAKSIKFAHPELLLNSDGSKYNETDLENTENFLYQRFDKKEEMYVGNQRLKEGTTEDFPADKDAFKGNVYVTTSGATYSAAVCFSKLIRDNNRGIIVGKETGGNANNTFAGYFLTYKLPKTRVTVTFSFTDLYFGENPPKVDSGIKPDKKLTVDERLGYLSQEKDPDITYILEKLIY